MPTFLTEPQWYDKNGALITPEKVKVNNAVSADVAERATDYFGKTEYINPPNFNVYNPPKYLLRAQGTTKTTEDATDKLWYELLPPDPVGYNHGGGSAMSAFVNLGSEDCKFGEVYAESFNGAVSHVNIYDTSSTLTNSYSLSLNGTTLTFTKKIIF